MASRPQLLSLEEVALRMGVPAGRIRKWCKAGRLPAEPSPDGQLRFTADAMLESIRPTPYEMSRLLTVEQTATVMQSCPALVNALTACGVIPMRLLPDSEMRILREDLNCLAWGPTPAPCVRCARRCGGPLLGPNVLTEDAPAEGVTWSGLGIVECWVDCAAMWRGK